MEGFNSVMADMLFKKDVFIHPGSGERLTVTAEPVIEGIPGKERVIVYCKTAKGSSRRYLFQLGAQVLVKIKGI